MNNNKQIKVMKTINTILSENKLTVKEIELLTFLNDELQDYLGSGYSDVDCKDVSTETNMSLNSVKGIVGSLVKKDILGTVPSSDIASDTYDLIFFKDQDDMEYEKVGTDNSEESVVDANHSFYKYLALVEKQKNMKKEELIEQVRELYKNGECYNTFSLEEHLGSDLLVKDNIDIVKHRWYETSVSIFKCSDGLLGIRLPSQLYESSEWSNLQLYFESSEWSDLYSGIEFYDVEEVMEVAYKTKKIKLWN